MVNADGPPSFSDRFTLFLDSPFTWGAIGMLFGAIVAAVPLSYYFVLAWFVIWVALVRAKFFEGFKSWNVIAGNVCLAIVLAFVFNVGYKYCPKPPTLDETADAIAKKIPTPSFEISQIQPSSQPQVSHSPIYLKSASAADIADAVMKRLPTPVTNPSENVNPNASQSGPSAGPTVPVTAQTRALKALALTLVGEINKWADSRLKDAPESLPLPQTPEEQKKAQAFHDLIASEWQDRYAVMANVMLNQLQIVQRDFLKVPVPVVHACYSSINLGSGNRGILTTRKLCAGFIQQAAEKLD